jgi:hypothetical protein
LAIELRKVRVVRCTEPRTTPGGSYPVNLSNFSLAFEPDFIIHFFPKQHLDIRIPMAPSIRVTLGTDASVAPVGDSNGYEFKYEPNFNWGITETWFNGQIEVNTAGKEVKYSKTFELDSLAIKCNGVYDYDNNVPYFGFKILTTSGYSSPANSNGFSVCKKFTKELGPIKATADVQTSVALGEQKYNPKVRVSHPTHSAD